jgi:hypothetical protein
LTLKWLGRTVLVASALLVLYVGAFVAMFDLGSPLHGANWPTPRVWIALHLYESRCFWEWDGWMPMVWLWLLTK